jgi:hypothetical protein
MTVHRSHRLARLLAAGGAGALIVLVSLGGFAYTARHRVGLAR